MAQSTGQPQPTRINIYGVNTISKHVGQAVIIGGLLFLGAGSVLHATHTRNMEEMGGLIRRMPVTALSFLVGAVAISGLPPLNGFVSEWLTYQALLAGFGTTQSLTRVMFPIAGSLLARRQRWRRLVSSRLLAFRSWLSRSEPAANAREVAPAMHCDGRSRCCVWSWAWARAGCYRCSTPLRNRPLVYAFLRRSLPQTALSVRGNTPERDSIDRRHGGGFAALGGVVPVLFGLWGRASHRTTGPAWDCGLPGLTADNEYTAPRSRSRCE
jgi:hydrogenase-4 component B